jgi:hypothetical protein
MATDVQPAAAAGATAEAAADRGAQHPSGGAGPARLSDDDHNLLFLLANIANDDPVEAKPGRRAARSRWALPGCAAAGARGSRCPPASLRFELTPPLLRSMPVFHLICCRFCCVFAP